MIFNDVTVVRSASIMPTMGMLMGNSVGREVWQQFDNQEYVSYFGEDFDRIRGDFHDKYLTPLESVRLELAGTINRISNPNHFRVLDSIEALSATPLCMELPILLYQPVRDLFERGRVEGYGFNVESLPDEDFYGRLIDNHYVPDVLAAMDDEGYFESSSLTFSDDIVLTLDEQDAIRATRAYILEQVLEMTDRDPTAISQIRG